MCSAAAAVPRSRPRSRRGRDGRGRSTLAAAAVPRLVPAETSAPGDSRAERLDAAQPEPFRRLVPIPLPFPFPLLSFGQAPTIGLSIAFRAMPTAIFATLVRSQTATTSAAAPTRAQSTPGEFFGETVKPQVPGRRLVPRHRPGLRRGRVGRGASGRRAPPPRGEGGRSPAAPPPPEDDERSPAAERGAALLRLFAHARDCTASFEAHESSAHATRCAKAEAILRHVNACTAAPGACRETWCPVVKRMLAHVVTCDRGATCRVCNAEASRAMAALADARPAPPPPPPPVSRRDYFLELLKLVRTDGRGERQGASPSVELIRHWFLLSTITRGGGRRSALRDIEDSAIAANPRKSLSSRKGTWKHSSSSTRSRGAIGESWEMGN